MNFRKMITFSVWKKKHDPKLIVPEYSVHFHAGKWTGLTIHWGLFESRIGVVLEWMKTVI